MLEVKRIHRHFIALPVLLALVVVTFASRSSLKASVASASISNETESPTVEYLGEGTRVLLFPGTRLNRTNGAYELVKGALLVEGEGIAEVTAGSLRFTGLVGAFYVTVQSGRVSVAAVSAPVYAEQKGKGVLVPVGYQWRDDEELLSIDAGYRLWAQGRDLTRIPASFHRTQLENLAMFSKQEKHASLPWHSLSQHADRLLAYVQLPEARERSRGASQAALLMQLEKLVEWGKEEETLNLLHSPQFDEFLRTQQGRSALTRMLADAVETTPVHAALLEPVLEDERLWLLASIHPDLREITWGIKKPRTGKEIGALYLMTLPQSDILPEPLPSHVLTRWEREVDHYVESLEDAEQFLDVLATSLIDLAGSFARSDYPQRFGLYHGVLSHMVENHGDMLSETHKEKISALEKAEDIDLEWNLDTQTERDADTGAIPEARGGVEHPPIELTPDQVEERAYILLRDRGALFTVNTVVEASSPQEARVQGVLFSAPQGDHEVDFTLDVATGEVSDVVFEERALPYSMPLERFTEWVRDS